MSLYREGRKVVFLKGRFTGLKGIIVKILPSTEMYVCGLQRTKKFFRKNVAFIKKTRQNNILLLEEIVEIPQALADGVQLFQNDESQKKAIQEKLTEELVEKESPLGEWLKQRYNYAKTY